MRTVEDDQSLRISISPICRDRPPDCPAGIQIVRKADTATVNAQPKIRVVIYHADFDFSSSGNVYRAL